MTATNALLTHATQFLDAITHTSLAMMVTLARKTTAAILLAVSMRLHHAMTTICAL
jgi:hypothetical protein